jgi:hypothetical protein
MKDSLRLYGNIIHGRENLLMLFKYHSRWNEHTLYLLSLEYNVYYSYYQPLFEQFDTKQLQSKLYGLQIEYRFSALIIDVEWGPFFNIASVDLFEEILPVGLLLCDDATMHDYNQVLAARASFVVTGCPIGHYKYLEADISSVNAYLSLSQGIYGFSDAKVSNTAATQDSCGVDFDLLWFGLINKADRRNYISAIVDKFPTLRFHIYQGPQLGVAMSGDLTWTQIATLIRRSGCVLNLTLSDFPIRTIWDHLLPRPFQRVSTQRPIEAGLGGSWCISEYSPGYVLWGLEELMPMFRSPTECQDIIERQLCNSKNSLDQHSEFVHYIRNKFSDKKTSQAIHAAVDGVKGQTARMISRVSTYYSQAAASQLNAWFKDDPARLTIELTLLEKSVNKTSWNFQKQGAEAGNYTEPIVRLT